MRRAILLIFFALLLASRAFATAPTIVDLTLCKNVENTTSDNNLVCTLTSAVNVGDFIAVAVNGDNSNVVTLTDNSTGGPNVWTENVAKDGAANSVEGHLFSTIVTHAFANGNTITATWATNVRCKSMTAGAWTGVASSGTGIASVDSSGAGSSGSSASATTGAILNVNTDVLKIGGIYAQGNTTFTSLGAGWAEADNQAQSGCTTNRSVELQYKVSNTLTFEAAVATITSNNWVGIPVNFNATNQNRYLKLAATNCEAANTADWADDDCWFYDSGLTSLAVHPVGVNPVLFTASSVAASGKTIAVTVNSAAKSVDFTSLANSPTLSISSTKTLTVNGALTFISGMTVSNSGTIVMGGAGGGSYFCWKIFR